MKATIVTLLGLAFLGVALTGVFAAGPGNGRGQGARQRGGACLLDGTEVKTMTGAIRDLVLPEVGSRQGPVRFTLVAGDTATAVRLGPPHALAAAGVTLADGDTVTVTGWSVTQDDETWLIPRELTLNGKTITLRNADGTPTWQGRGGNGQGCGQGAGCGNCQRRRGGACRNQANNG